MNCAIDSGRVAASFNSKASEYDGHVLVQKRVVSQLTASIVDHLEIVPEQILDVGTGTGSLLEKLHTRFPAAALTGIDIAHNMCAQAHQKLGQHAQIIQADAASLPFNDGLFDLVVSASALQWVNNLENVLTEIRRVVRPGGRIFLAFFSEGTLCELQESFREISNLRSPADSLVSRLHRFRSADEVKAIADDIDFESFVVNEETEVDWYKDLNTLLRSIKNIGAGAHSGTSSNGLGWRGVLNETSKLYQERFGENGLIPATYKVIYLSATVG